MHLLIAQHGDFNNSMSHNVIVYKIIIFQSTTWPRAGLKDRQTRQLPRAPKQEGPPGFHHSKALDIELST